MKKSLITNGLFYTAVLLLALPTQMYAQSLGLQSAGQKLATELEGVFPYIAGGIFIFVAFRNLGNFVGENADIWKGIKNLAFYILAVLVAVGIYRFVKSQAL